MQHYGDDVGHVPNIVMIDQIGKVLEGRRPDDMSAIKGRFKLGLFMAREENPESLP